MSYNEYFYLERKRYANEINEFGSLTRLNEELKDNLTVKESQVLDLSAQIAEVKESLRATTMKNKILEGQLEEVKKIKPMLDIRKNYINLLENKVRNLEKFCSTLNEENCKLKFGINRLEKFRFHSFLASMGKATNLLQSQWLENF